MTKQEEPAAEATFEQTLDRLEEIVHLLEEGEVGLDEALLRYEEGVRLLRKAYQSVERAQRKIEILSGLDAEGNPRTQPLADVSTLTLDEQAAATVEEEKKRRPRRGS
jgi:exodeoxyribonuclease VII small subunit